MLAIARWPEGRTRVRWLLCVVSGGFTLCLESPAHADNFDVGWFFTRVGGWRESPVRAIVMLGLLMLANYVLNVIVIGLPAYKMGAPLRKVTWDLGGLTILGQVCDRAGALLGGLVGVLAAFQVSGEEGLGRMVGVGILSSFVLSGTAVGLLTYYYLRKRWKLVGGWTTVVAIASAVLTNPAWAMAAAPFTVPSRALDIHSGVDPRHGLAARSRDPQSEEDHGRDGA